MPERDGSDAAADAIRDARARFADALPARLRAMRHYAERLDDVKRSTRSGMPRLDGSRSAGQVKADPAVHATSIVL